MFTKKLTTISIAAVATFAAYAASIEGASARSIGIRVGFHHHGGYRHHGWGYRRHRFGYYGAPLLVSSFGPECYYVRRFGTLYRICG